mmetsp:Transcript_10899/g.42237  ORF Transcript_10899/g.42237 Transcript_10899/m.42237 type:complete len:202 (+) Transcript_10899:87-692(+)
MSFAPQPVLLFLPLTPWQGTHGRSWPRTQSILRGCLCCILGCECLQRKPNRHAHRCLRVLNCHPTCPARAVCGLLHMHHACAGGQDGHIGSSHIVVCRASEQHSCQGSCASARSSSANGVLHHKLPQWAGMAEAEAAWRPGGCWDQMGVGPRKRCGLERLGLAVGPKERLSDGVDRCDVVEAFERPVCPGNPGLISAVQDT